MTIDIRKSRSADEANDSQRPDNVSFAETALRLGGKSADEARRTGLVDAADDQVALLVLDSSGSGVFYYLNVLLNDGNGTLGQSRETFIGDRIKFDFMDIYGAESVSRMTGVPIHPDDYGQLVVGYYIHGPEQAYAEKPGIYITRHWKIESGRLVMVDDY